MKKIKIILTSFMVVLLFGSAASALPVVGPDDWNVSSYTGDNGFDAVTVEKMQQLNGNFGTNLLEDGAPYEATGRAAFFIGNDTGKDIKLPKKNIGLLNDGLLNGDDKEWDLYDINDPTNTDDKYVFDGLEFISESDFQYINDDDIKDPGWIYLGKYQTDQGSVDYANLGGDDGIGISDLIEISVEWNEGLVGSKATWTLTPKADILEKAGLLLGNSYFDHLAIVLKSSTYFAVYDLDFNKIFNLEKLTEEYFAPMKLTGTLDNSDFSFLNEDGKGISHIGFWAHDPIPSAVVPEPASLILLGSGLAGLAVLGIRRKKNS